MGQARQRFVSRKSLEIDCVLTWKKQIRRFQTLISLMLSSQTKDTVNAVAMKRLQTELPGGLCLESILDVEPKRLDELIRVVSYPTSSRHCSH